MPEIAVDAGSYEEAGESEARRVLVNDSLSYLRVARRINGNASPDPIPLV